MRVRACALAGMLSAAGAVQAAGPAVKQPEAVSPLLGTAPGLEQELPPAPDPQPAAPAGRIEMPIAGLTAAELRDTFAESRAAGRRHEALDILAAEGTPVRAVVSGRVAKMFLSELGGLTLYQFDEDEQFSFYYAHLSAYAEGLQEGQLLQQGEVLGYVGHTGNASAQAPHLHFEIKRLDADRHWWQGRPLNPFLYLISGRAPQALSGSSDS